MCDIENQAPAYSYGLTTQECFNGGLLPAGEVAFLDVSVTEKQETLQAFTTRNWLQIPKKTIVQEAFTSDQAGGMKKDIFKGQRLEIRRKKYQDSLTCES